MKPIMGMAIVGLLLRAWANYRTENRAVLSLVGRSPTTLRQWLGITTIYVFVPTAENLQPNQIAAFKREILQLNLADKARWLTAFLQRCRNSMNSSCQISRLLEKNHAWSILLSINEVCNSLKL